MTIDSTLKQLVADCHQSWHQTLISGAMNIVNKCTDSVSPIVACRVISNKEIKNIFIPIVTEYDFSGPDIKHECMATIAENLLEQGMMPLIVGMISEAWKTYISPDNHASERQEIIMVASLTCQGDTLASCASVMRDIDNNIHLGVNEFTTMGQDVDMNLLTVIYQEYIKNMGVGDE